MSRYGRGGGGYGGGGYGGGYDDYGGESSGLIEDDRRVESSQFLDQQIEDYSRDIQERDDAVAEIEQTMTEVNEIYRDLASLVDEQGEQLDNIESNMMDAEDRVDNGVGQLVKATKYQKKARSKMCCVLIVLSCALAVGVAIIMLGQKGDDDSSSDSSGGAPAPSPNAAPTNPPTAPPTNPPTSPATNPSTTRAPDSTSLSTTQSTATFSASTATLMSTTSTQRLRLALARREVQKSIVSTNVVVGGGGLTDSASERGSS